MRVTPTTMVNPAAMMNSDEALASPLSACTRRNETSGKRVPREHSVGGGAVPSLADQDALTRGAASFVETLRVALGFGPIPCARPAPQLPGTGTWRRPRTA